VASALLKKHKIATVWKESIQPYGIRVGKNDNCSEGNPFLWARGLPPSIDQISSLPLLPPSCVADFRGCKVEWSINHNSYNGGHLRQ